MEAAATPARTQLVAQQTSPSPPLPPAAPEEEAASPFVEQHQTLRPPPPPPPPPAPEKEAASPQSVVEAVPLDITRRLGNSITPRVAFRAPSGFKVVSCISAGGKGKKGLVLERVKEQRESSPKPPVMKVLQGMEQTHALGIRDGSGVQMTSCQRENLVSFAVQHNLHGNIRQNKETGEAVRPFDINAAGRTFANGEAMAAWQVYDLLHMEQQERHFLMMELLHLRGWEPPTSQPTFYPPGAHRTESENRGARRQLEMAASYINKLKAIFGGPEGLLQWCILQLTGSITGSKVRRKSCHIDSQRGLDVLWEHPLARKRFEVLRKRVPMFTPTRINAWRRAAHAGARQMKFARSLASGQVPRTETLLQAQYRALDYQLSVVPAGTDIEEVVMVSPDEKEQQLAAAAATSARRAKLARAVELEERKLLLSEAQQEANAIWEMAQQDMVEDEQHPEEALRKEALARTLRYA